MSISLKKDKPLENLVPYPFYYSEHKLLQEIKRTHSLESFFDPEKSDFHNIMNLRFWIYSNWPPINSSFPEKNKELSSFKKAAGIAKSSNPEYSWLTKACLKALGFIVRDIKIHNPEVSSQKQNSKHFLFEVYLEDIGKWFFIDQEFDIIICKEGIPLNAMELQQAFFNEEELEIMNPLKKIECEDYLEYIGSYLNTFSTPLNKVNQSFWDGILRSKKHLLLLPEEQETTRSLQKLNRKKNIITKSISEFYPTPVI